MGAGDVSADAGPAGDSVQAPALSMQLPTHENIAIWGRVGHLTPSQTDALRQLQRMHPELSDREARLSGRCSRTPCGVMHWSFCTVRLHRELCNAIE